MGEEFTQMATIRVRDWTKKQIEEILEEESHSSHDSVIKALLKDRKPAKFAGTDVETEESTSNADQQPPEDKAFDELTVLSEMYRADNDVLFSGARTAGRNSSILPWKIP